MRPVRRVHARSHLLPLAIAALLAGCDNSPALTHYVLALSWQPAFCEFNGEKPECRDLDGGDFGANNLTVHGLWPNDAPASGPSHCGVDAATRTLDTPESWCELPAPEIGPRTRAALEQAMPGTASCLDRHEWIKHGSCSGIDAESYFRDTLRLAKAVQSTRLGEVVAANVGRIVTAQQLANAFEVAFGAGASRALTLVCAERNGRHYLAEIRIALETDGLTGPLERDDLYLAVDSPASSCPEDFLIDSAD
jgi:ribonuclease T2